jgi:hypothetical protein
MNNIMRKIPVLLWLALVALWTTFGESLADDAPEGYPSIAEIMKGGGCAPKDNMARILESANPLDFASNWSKTNYVGTSLDVYAQALCRHRASTAGFFSKVI